MKLIIDIPDIYYSACKDWKTNGVATTAEAIIANGTPYEERPKGEWYYNYQNGWHCSICNKSVKDMPTVMGKANFDFCPKCGAYMRGDV